MQVSIKNKLDFNNNLTIIYLILSIYNYLIGPDYKLEKEIDKVL